MNKKNIEDSHPNLTGVFGTQIGDGSTEDCDAFRHPNLRGEGKVLENADKVLENADKILEGAKDLFNRKSNRH
jgi:hypothetical protein